MKVNAEAWFQNSSKISTGSLKAMIENGTMTFSQIEVKGKVIHILTSFRSSPRTYSLFAECEENARIYDAHGRDCESCEREQGLRSYLIFNCTEVCTPRNDFSTRLFPAFLPQNEACLEQVGEKYTLKHQKFVEKTMK